MTTHIVPATGARFADVEVLLAPKRREAPACWCLTYRVDSAEFNRLRGDDRPNRLRALCERDVAPGVLAYVDGEAAGWCALGPRTEMGRLTRSRTIQRVDDQPVWSIVCFVVRPGYRRRGLAHQLLAEAVDYARSSGATIVEGYPIDSGATRISAAFAYVGTVSLFESAGFHKVAETTSRTAGLSRWIMRRELDTAP